MTLTGFRTYLFHGFGALSFQFVPYDKYVSNRALFEINISYGSRQGLIECFSTEKDKKIEDAKMFVIFDASCREVFGLLMDSFIRFIKKPVYLQLCESRANAKDKE